MKKKGPGRPEAEIKREMRCIRVLPDEWAQWGEAAEYLDVKTSELIRRVVNRAAKRALRQKRSG